jgi:hypothetical protein
MLAAEHYPDLFVNVAPPENELLEIHHTKISLHHAKAGYDYPSIRLPFAFSGLKGLSTRVYQTVHNGALAFLVVVSSFDKDGEEIAKKSKNAKLSAKSPHLDMAEVFSKAAGQLTYQPRFGITLH